MTGIRESPKTNVILAPLLFLLAFLSPTSAQTKTDPFAPIVAALQSGEFEKALDLIRPALQASPANAQLWAMQATAYAGEGHAKEARTSFRSALKLSPDYIPALQGEAQLEFEAGNPAGIPVLRHLLHLRPDDRTSHGMLAILEYQQGNYGAAVSNFEKTGALFDSKPDALHAWAICLVKLKNFDQAANVFQRSLALNPDGARERQLLASIQLMAKQSEAALATLQPLLNSGSADAGTLELASTAYEDLHDTEHAVDTLRRAILLEPQNVNLYLDFANISSQHQSFQVGINVVNDGLGLQPKAAPLYFARGVLYVQLAEYDKAQADFEKAYELDPSQSLSVAAQGLAAVQANDLDGALSTIQAKLRQKPNDPVLLYLQADILTQKGAEPGSAEYQLAMRSAKKSLTLQPTLVAAHGVLAKLYLQSSQYQEAIVECRKVLGRNPKDQAAVYHLVQALRKTGGKGEIPELLKRLALLRQQATKEERERYRYKLVEGDTQNSPPARP